MEEGVSESQNYTAQLLCGCICFMKLCKDVQMGAPSLCDLMSQRLCSGGSPSRSCVTKASAPQLWATRYTLVPSTLAVQHPQLIRLDTLPLGARHTSAGHKEAHCTFSSTPHVLCLSKDNTAKSNRKCRCFWFPKRRNICMYGRVVLFASPLASPQRSHSKEHRAPRALVPSHRDPCLGLMGFVPEPHLCVLQSLSELVQFCRALTNWNSLMKTCPTKRFPARSDLGACVSLPTRRGHLEMFVHKPRCSKHV